VTVLFADVVHSMDIAAAVGAERLRELMGELFSRCSTVVQRYGGTVDKFTGDGIMAVFGAPIALEDHALRACRAALDIQKNVHSLEDEVEHRDHVALQLRVGLNSGGVITGEIGTGPLSYTAVGEQVGMAERMEAVAPPGGVMVSESTARLVENVAILGDPELVHIKGTPLPVSARRLLAIATGRRTDRVEPSFVGRDWEMGALRGMLDRAMKGKGCVVGVVGSPGIGKSRIVREITSIARNAGVEISTTHCESHTTEIPFHAAAGLVRATTNSQGLDSAAARTQVRARFSGADDEDLLILEDLLGIGDPAATLPQIDPDARRRRLAAMVNAAALARSTPTVYVIEDAHWIDAISESMLADFLSVVPRTRSLVLITYRPEYVGVLAHAPRSQTIALEPLDDSQMSQLSIELVGSDRSVAGLADLVAERAAGNPFFAEEIVRDLTERDVLIGGRGCYLCAEPASDVSVPSTLQAVIAARIDRLDATAKRALNAASVIGSQFSPQMLEALEVHPALDDLVLAELIDQTVFGPRPEYTFRHSLIRAVAYESQLKSDRAQLHRRLAAVIDQSDPNATLIAEHLDSAGDLHGAYHWQMRAGAWLTNRDIAAALLSWERALQAADALPVDEPDRTAMRIAPRSALCSNAWRRFHPDMWDRFEELRALCMQAGDKASMATAMVGMTLENILQGNIGDASRSASEYMAIVESISDPSLTIGLSFAAIVAKYQSVELVDMLRWTQVVIDLAQGDPTKGAMVVGSPLATALVWRGVGRWAAGHREWRDDLDTAIGMYDESDPLTQSMIITFGYGSAFVHGALLADDAALHRIEAALPIVEQSSDELARVLIRMTLGVTLIHLGAERERGFEILRELKTLCVSENFALNAVPLFDVYLARSTAEGGQLDHAVESLRDVIRQMLTTTNLIYVTLAVAALVETLLKRGSEEDLEEAEAAIERLAATRAGDPWVIRDLTSQRLQALLAQARGDQAGYHEFRDRYRTMANEYGYEGHMAWAAAMP
jgi:adenylate cyclase